MIITYFHPSRNFLLLLTRITTSPEGGAREIKTRTGGILKFPRTTKQRDYELDSESRSKYNLGTGCKSGFVEYYRILVISRRIAFPGPN